MTLLLGVDLHTGDLPWRSLAGPGARVSREGERTQAGRESIASIAVAAPLPSPLLLLQLLQDIGWAEPAGD